MAQNSLNGLNQKFPIKNADGSSFYGLELKKATHEWTNMSLADKITGEVYYNSTYLPVTLSEYVECDGVHYVLVNPPTLVRNGLVKDNNDTKGMSKFSFEFYHPMYQLGNMEFTDVAVSEDETQYLSESRTFSWIGKIKDFCDKLNKNLQGTEFICVVSESVSQDKLDELSEVLPFDNAMISDALKTFYDTWKVPFVVDDLEDGEIYEDTEGQEHDYYDEGKRYVILLGYPTNAIMKNGSEYVFKMGKGLGLKNNSRTPKNNKVVTRLAGYGSERNIPYGYPQIPWYGDQSAEFTYSDHAGVYYNVTIGNVTFEKVVSYPIYNGILGGQNVRLIKHPFTRKHLMPTDYATTLFNKVSIWAESGVVNRDYDPDATLIDYLDADGSAVTPINLASPVFEIHEFEDIYPRLGEESLYDDAVPYVGYDPSGGLDWSTQAAFKTFVMSQINSSTIQEERNALSYFFLEEVQDQGYDYNSEWEGSSDNFSYKCTATAHVDKFFCYITYTSSSVNFVKKVLRDGVTPEEVEDASLVWDDTMDDNGEYVQSYFKVTLPVLDFDLYACASITESTQINMRSGACLGCTFDVYVDWDDYKKNFYDEDGNFAPSGEQRDDTKYPDTSVEEVTLIVKKDLETFGTLMPNIYQQPKEGDEFVILGISLPQEYITDAQDELLNAMGDYLDKNNVPYYEYPLTFDEAFLRNNTDILNQMRQNTKVTFEFNGVNNALYIKQMSVKYGDTALPTYNISLSNDIEVVTNAIGQTTEDIGKLRVQMNELQKYYGEDLAYQISEKLSRVADDVAQGHITFAQGVSILGASIFDATIQSQGFVSGMTTGRGWRMDKNGNLELESIRVRSALEANELLVNRVQGQEGDVAFTDNDKIDNVAMYNDANETIYILSLHEKWDGYVTTQEEGNILRGIINTLGAKQAGVSDEDPTLTPKDGSNSYYTSWSYVIRKGLASFAPFDSTENYSIGDAFQVSTQTYIFVKNHSAGALQEGEYTSFRVNQIAVKLYEDNAVPAQKNYEPCEAMVITRWGCLGNPQDQSLTPSEKASIERRQRSFYLSNTDGRITKLVGVNSPILREDNYGTTLGTLPDFVQGWSIASRLIDGRDYLYAQGVVVGDFIKVDIDGHPLINFVDKGDWLSNVTYLANEYNPTSLQWETHDVWHNGNYYRCQVTNTGLDPSTHSTEWKLLMKSGEDGRDGTSVRIVGSVVAIVSTSASDFPADATINDGDIGILTSDPRIYVASVEVDPNQHRVVSWNAASAPSLDDAYIASTDSTHIPSATKGHLFVLVSLAPGPNAWKDAGQIKGDKGDQGDDGYSIVAQYAPNNNPQPSEIHNTWQAGDEYMRTKSTDPSASWSSWQKVKGEDGAETTYEYGISQYLTIVSPTTAPSDIQTWYDTPINVTDSKPYLWAKVTRSNVWNSQTSQYETTIRYMRLTGEKGQKGDKGDTGATGKTSRNYYYGGRWEDFVSDVDASFEVTDYESPYFEYTNPTSQKTNKWMFVGENGTYDHNNMPVNPSSSASSVWEIMVTDFKYLISEAVFAQFAHFGGAIITGDWMISQYGTIDGNASQDFEKFDANHPNEDYVDPVTGNHNFVPNYAVDMLTGKAYMNDCEIKGKVVATEGEFTGRVVATSGSFTGEVHASSGDFTGTIHANAGEFAGMIKTLFVDLANSDATYDQQEGGYLLHTNLNINDYSTIYTGVKNIILPNDVSYVGAEVNIYVPSLFVSSMGGMTIKVQNGDAIEGFDGLTKEDIQNNKYAKTIYWYGGLMSLIAVPMFGLESTYCRWIIKNFSYRYRTYTV